MAVQIIKATIQASGTGQTGAALGRKIRVAAYCRVSTDSEEQESSYEVQCRHYTDFITANPDWELAGIYADEGISGTSTKRREQFNRMIADCESGRIDMVITKSISRWARNTIDSLQYIRKLKALGIPILYEKENINTMEASGEVLITIMSSLAQQESESISRNVRMGIQYRMQQGKGRLNTAQFLGLARDPETKDLVIIPEEAVLVRRIYREYLEGLSPGMIAARLTREKIAAPAGKSTWYQSTIVSILENEKYCGDLLMQKYYVADFLTHRIEKNNGALPQYFVEDAHEPIVPKEVFCQVQSEIQRRSLLKYDPARIRCGSPRALQNRLVCGHCGRTLKRYAHRDPQLTDWRCRKRAAEKKSGSRGTGALCREETERGSRGTGALCPCRIVPEREAQRAILRAVNQLPGRRDELIRMQGAAWDGERKRIDAALRGIKEQKQRLKDRLEQLTGERSTAVPGETGRKTAGGKSAVPIEPAAADFSRSGEESFLREEIERLEMEMAGLVVERAEAADTGVKIRLLLELIDAMARRRECRPAGREPGRPCDQIDSIWSVPPDRRATYDSPACRDYEDFFRRTCVVPGEAILGEDGKVRVFSDEMITRYLECVVIFDDGYEVRFKGGLGVEVNIL